MDGSLLTLNMGSQ